MKGAVEKVLREEEQARISLERARAQADSSILKAKEDSQVLIEEAAAQVKGVMEQRTAESTREFLAEKDLVLTKAKDGAANLRRARDKDIADIAHRVFLEIINIED